MGAPPLGVDSLPVTLSDLSDLAHIQWHEVYHAASQQQLSILSVYVAYVFSILYTRFRLEIPNCANNRAVGKCLICKPRTFWVTRYIHFTHITNLWPNRGDDAESPAGSTANQQPSFTEACMPQALTSSSPSSNRVLSPLATNSNNTSSSSSATSSSRCQVHKCDVLF